MKYLVIDAEGMVGQVVSLWLKEALHEVHDICTPTYNSLDIIAKEIISNSYDAVINCAAIVNKYAEKDKSGASFINAFLPHYLEELTADTKTVIVHRSTDCVFSGSRGQYGLNDIPDAPSFYARTKAIGELLNDKDITIRTSLIGPEIEEGGEGLFNWFYHQTETCGFANAIWTGLTTIEFAKEIDKLVQGRSHGVFQLVPDAAISKYDLLQLFEEYYPGNRVIKKVDNKRVDKSLIPVKPDDLIIPNYKIQIQEMRRWTDKHIDIYRYR